MAPPFVALSRLLSSEVLGLRSLRLAGAGVLKLNESFITSLAGASALDGLGLAEPFVCSWF